MTQVHLETDLAEWFLQSTFIASVIFAVVYGLLFNWRQTVTGRSMMLLVCAIVGALLHGVLLQWGVDVVTINPNISPHNPSPYKFDSFDNVLSWASIVGLAFAGIAIVLLMWQAIRSQLAATEVRNKYIEKLFLLNGHNHNGHHHKEEEEV